MDAGLAAALGALAGSVATIGAALATGWAQREGARITARSEHRLQRREPRNASYKAFITAVSHMRDLTTIFVVSYDQFPFERVGEEFAQRCSQVADQVREAWVDVALSGPKNVTEVASSLERLSNALAFRTEGLVRLLSTQERVLSSSAYEGVKDVIAEEAQKFDDAVENFILLAQTALDDDGSLS
jgi:hypothetical protein